MAADLLIHVHDVASRDRQRRRANEGWGREAKKSFALRVGLIGLLLLGSPGVTAQDDGKAGDENAKATNATTAGGAGEDKSYKICSVLGGLDITRLVSSSTRSFFQGAIEDVELVREYVSESAYSGGLATGGDGLDVSSANILDELSATLDSEARGLPEGTTTLEANLGYCDDRPDRTIERYVGTGPDQPLVGTKADDMAILNSVAALFPWIIDRKSNEASWHLPHLNGRSEGPTKEPFRFDALYTAAWIGTYGEAWSYYPPLRVYGHPFGFGDVLGPAYQSHEEAFVKPNLPENNPDRVAFFTKPYPDTAVPGLSLITAMAPIYYTGTFRDNVYDDTYLASTGVDIAVSSVSTLLDVLEGTLTHGSFGILVDSDFNTIVLSQAVVEKIYPPRTGFEESRVEYSLADGSIVQDRRNQTYLVSDTILQPLTDLDNADWVALRQEVVEGTAPGERGYSTLDLTLTGDVEPTQFYVLYERWPFVADWVLMAFAPVSEVQNAIKIGIYMRNSDGSLVGSEAGSDEEGGAGAGAGAGADAASSVMEGERGGPPIAGTAVLINAGTLDVTVATKKIPPWIELRTPLATVAEGGGQSLPAGSELVLGFDVSTDALELGTSSSVLLFHVQDDKYPDCFFNEDIGLDLSVRVTPKQCPDGKVDDGTGTCACPPDTVGERCTTYGVLFTSIFVPLAVIGLAGVFVYLNQKRKQADSVWAVKISELRFDDPPEIAGRGTFGLVLLAEYRGTKVAVKRVIPPRGSKSKGRSSGKDSGSGEMVHRNPLLGSGDRDAVEEELERPDGIPSLSKEKSTSRINRHSSMDMVNFHQQIQVEKEKMGQPVEPENPVRSASISSTNAIKNPKDKAGRKKSLDFMFQQDHLEAGTLDQTEGAGASCGDVAQDKEKALADAHVTFEKEIESGTKPGSVRHLGFSSGLSSGTTVGTASGGSLRKGSKKSKAWSWWNKAIRRRDEYSILKQDFVKEMRHLSKLRHPCITTVMGAVISRWEEPMLVMEYMDHGSLHDLLHNETMVIEGDLVLPILRDIAQGCRFLHAANPPVIHGDLKAQNVLVDIKMRAKVADFGLSQKKKMGATGTPFWMAPELLRGESGSTMASDVFSFGVILYEVYSRKDPYYGENHREVLRQVCDPAINKRPPIPKSMPPAVASLMSDCLVADPESRPSFNELDNRLKRMDVANIEPGKMIFSHQAAKVQEAERNASLLLEVFPKHIAEALRDGRKVAPEHHECVSIFFSDIVGFTTIAASITPLKVSDMLDRLYLAFDALSRKHEVFKIETIGDAWMGVTNLVQDQSGDHAKRIAKFAIDAVRVAGETLIDVDDPAKGFVQIRVGFHSGPVLSNVVGSRNPKFGVFGDTVNTSARMESNSLPGRIHCSDRAANLLKVQAPDIPLICRGKISIKGKGELTTWWVHEVVSPDSPAPAQ